MAIDDIAADVFNRHSAMLAKESGLFRPNLFRLPQGILRRIECGLHPQAFSHGLPPEVAEAEARDHPALPAHMREN